MTSQGPETVTRQAINSDRARSLQYSNTSEYSEDVLEYERAPRSGRSADAAPGRVQGKILEGEILPPETYGFETLQAIWEPCPHPYNEADASKAYAAAAA